MDVHHDKDTNNINVTFELPGLQKEDVSIDVHNNVFAVPGEERHLQSMAKAAST
jgi:HSP20 family protein